MSSRNKNVIFECLMEASEQEERQRVDLQMLNNFLNNTD